jgi:Amt family ammonium transporter
VFEVLETHFVENTATLQWNVDRLREFGIGIEIDNFGTGHASLGSVFALRPDRIKIDPMFTQAIDSDGDQRSLLEGLVDLVKRSGSHPVVQGVETEAQIAVLKEMGVGEVQGYAIANPMPRDELSGWLDRELKGGKLSRQA